MIYASHNIIKNISYFIDNQFYVNFISGSLEFRYLL